MDKDITEYTVEDWLKNESENLKLLNDESQLNKIPLLNVTELHNVKDNRLVRFHGMVQDMYSPEYYMEKYEVFNKESNQTTIESGKYTDGNICKDNEVFNLKSSSCVTSERQTYVVVTDPALNEWVKNIEVQKCRQPLEEKPQTSGCNLKRNLEDEEEMDTDNSTPDKTVENVPNLKKCRTDEQNNTLQKNILSQDHLLNFPLPERSGKVCHIKVYENTDSIKLNELFEFVGFLSTTNLADADENSGEFESQIEVQTHNPPPFLIPRIHCVRLRKLPHSNPLVSSEELNFDKSRVIFNELLIVFTQLLLGDKLAAEYCIYHFISVIYSRTDSMALGKFSLNLFNIPNIADLDYAKELYKFIELLVPKSHYFPMTLENMNTLSLIPKKDYECNRLTSGMLQLSANTHLVLDEIKLSAGKLDVSGVNNVKALANVIRNQKLVYDFNYYPLEFDCDIPILVVSEGKSILPSDCHIMLKPDDTCVNTFPEIIEAAKHFLKPELLNEIRVYLSLARMAKFDISESAHELIQNEFVNMRQKGSVSGNDLHSLLVLARLVCISRGKSTLDEESWKLACSLEEERKSRIILQ